MSSTPSGIPFSFFISLLYEISHVAPQKTTVVRPRTNDSYPAINIFRRWIVQLRIRFSPLPPGSTSIIFRLLFPEEDTSRKYDMQETKLSRHLGDCLGVDAQKLERWCSEGSSGCLGHELEHLLENICPSNESVSSLSLSQVDDLLDELASNSAFSDPSIRKKYPRETRRGRLTLLKALFRTLSPIEASFLAHIILKDLRPMLYPLRETHYTTSLIRYNTTSVQMLTKAHAMQVWDPSCTMLKAYHTVSTIEAAAAYFESPSHERGPNIPCIGTPVEIPKSAKGRGYLHALRFFGDSRRVWAETKYDGERAQIHVEVLPGIKPRITIFSKSKRNSTMDRRAIHEPILNALSLSSFEGFGPKFRNNVILDAEMVACHGSDIDEFWKIRNLIECTAYGVRHFKGSKSNSSPSLGPDAGHLALVFFDVLLVDSVSLLSTPYAQRREILESIVQPISGQSMFSDRVSINLHSQSEAQVLRSLERVFQNVVDNRQEGIVLKADEASYHDLRFQWVKLKKDYIPGYGDTLDLVVVGAGWDKARARELRVAPTTFTTLYIGALANPCLATENTGFRPRFQVYFMVSYGLDRHRLEEVNFLLKNTETVPYCASVSPGSLPYDFTLLGSLPPPNIFLRTPLLAEFVGAGFTKAPDSKYYELRFPRVTKVYRTKERSWKDGMDLRGLQKIAQDAVVPNRSDKEVRDWCNSLWGQSASPTIKSSMALKRTSSDTTPVQNASNRIWTSLEPSLSPRKRARTSDFQLVISQASVLPTRRNVYDRLSDPAILISEDQNSQLGSPPKSPISTTVPGSIKPPLCRSSYACVQPRSVDTRDVCVTPQHAPSSLLPRMEFLEHALVWFAKPSGCLSSPVWSWKNSIPRQQRLHSIESLLAGCGWHADGAGSAWVTRGVVFVDGNDDMGNKWKFHALNAIEQLQKTHKAISSHKSLPRKPIWIFDIKSWTLEGCDIQKHALACLE